MNSNALLNNFKLNKFNIKNYNLNFGQQKLSAHEALSLILTLDGEAIKSYNPHIGFLNYLTKKFIGLYAKLSEACAKKNFLFFLPLVNIEIKHSFPLLLLIYILYSFSKRFEIMTYIGT